MCSVHDQKRTTIARYRAMITDFDAEADSEDLSDSRS
jgi:hypothetical protein